MITQDDRNMVVYFMTEKGDITRWCAWEEKKEEIFKEFPQLEKALKDVTLAEDYLQFVIDKYFTY